MGEGVAVNWPYPPADATWIDHFSRKLGPPKLLPDAAICTILSSVPAAAAAVKGVVVYEASKRIDALQWIAATAAGQLDAVPVTQEMLTANPCLSRLPVVLRLPLVSTFATDLSASVKHDCILKTTSLLSVLLH